MQRANVIPHCLEKLKVKSYTAFSCVADGTEYDAKIEDYNRH